MFITNDEMWFFLLYFMIDSNKWKATSEIFIIGLLRDLSETNKKYFTSLDDNKNIVCKFLNKSITLTWIFACLQPIAFLLIF